MRGATRPPPPPQLQRNSAQTEACDCSDPVAAAAGDVLLHMNGTSDATLGWTRNHNIDSPSSLAATCLRRRGLFRGSSWSGTSCGEEDCSCHTCHIPRSWTSAERSRDALVVDGALWPVSDELLCARPVILAPCCPTRLGTITVKSKGRQQMVYGLELTCLEPKWQRRGGPEGGGGGAQAPKSSSLVAVVASPLALQATISTRKLRDHRNQEGAGEEGGEARSSSLPSSCYSASKCGAALRFDDRMLNSLFLHGFPFIFVTRACVRSSENQLSSTLLVWVERRDSIASTSVHSHKLMHSARWLMKRCLSGPPHTNHTWFNVSHKKNRNG